jgi:oligopeptide/dipeptide ABC transporter ATP-binding protein
VDLSTVRLETYRTQLGVVLQDTFLFDGSIEENIAFARPNATKEQILEACRIARVDEFAENFEKKYDTIVGERGVKLSGGQRQRVSIARALAVEPRLLICDEPVSALDASSRNYVLRLLDELRNSLELPIVVISHDLSSLAGIADRIVVMYHGRIVEDGPVGQVFAAPRHPYTALLMASVPSVRHDQPLSLHQLRRADDDPVPPDGPDACVFAARCPFIADACAEQPPSEAVEGRWTVACHRREEWMALAQDRNR